MTQSIFKLMFLRTAVRHWHVLVLIFAIASIAHAIEPSRTSGVEVRRFKAPEASQAVGVDDAHFYAISNRVIAKYSKSSGELAQRWEAPPDLAIEHLNSALVMDGKLYCAHSNFPRFPETSSIEIFDAATLAHIGSHSLGIDEGSLTWIDWHEGAWWAVFAHYDEKVNDNPHAKNADWTSLVKFDRDWRRVAGWVFPEEVIAKFRPHSCSGGSWGPSNRLYCTGHDRGELYILALPKAGATLNLLDTADVPITGQGFAWDRSEPGTLYGIDRPKREVVVVNLADTLHARTEPQPKPRSNPGRSLRVVPKAVGE